MSPSKEAVLDRFRFQIVKPPRGEELRLYRTGLFCSDWSMPRPPYKGRGWRFAMRHLVYKGRSDDLYPSRQKLFDVMDSTYVSMIRFSMHAYRIQHRTSDKVQNEIIEASDPELMLYARDWERAMDAMNLWRASFLTIEGPLPFLDLDTIAAVPTNDEERECIAREYRFRPEPQWGAADSFARAAYMAAKASHKARWCYALHKLHLSLKIHSIPYRDTDPSEGFHRGIERSHSSHVMFAQAIIAAYSAIEELGLEVRSSQKNPAFENGTWVPAVRSEILERLRKARVDTDEIYPWIERWRRPRVETIKNPRPPRLSGGKASWARGEVQDKLIRVEDAIARARWLRNRLSSHRLPPEARSLTAFDVNNVQMLARRLIMEVAGFQGMMKAP